MKEFFLSNNFKISHIFMFVQVELAVPPRLTAGVLHLIWQELFALPSIFSVRYVSETAIRDLVEVHWSVNKGRRRCVSFNCCSCLFLKGRIDPSIADHMRNGKLKARKFDCLSYRFLLLLILLLELVLVKLWTFTSNSCVTAELVH